MDIENKKSFLSVSKRFTLKATASAILTLNAETVVAVDCTSQIVGSTLAGVICDFNANTGSSVTVETGGTVGGISLSAPYIPSSPSKITIEVGGLVSNALTGIGILVDQSILSDGIINKGTINVQSTGILINRTSTISGGISNSGSIVSSSLTGIKIATSNTINGGISNSGSINALTNNGIVIETANIINGGISNSGSISSAGAGILIKSRNIINGGISNSGSIESSSRTGIQVFLSNTIHGGISNSGSIITNGDFVGIVIQGSHSGPGNQIDGGIYNSGLIQAGPDGNAITIHQGNNTITGDIFNSGMITAGHSGIYLASAFLQGNITNSGSIIATNAYGINILNASSVVGEVINSGLIHAGTAALSISGNSTIVGNITNSGTAHGDQQGMVIATSAIVSGHITNSGIISGSSTGIAVFSGATVSGGITNSGTIQGGTKAIYIDASSNVNNIDIVGQQARVIGNVDAQSTDFNINSGALFTSEGTFVVNNFNVGSDAIFNMANTITANSVNNAGTLIVGTMAQTIIGNYRQTMGGTFQIGVSNTTHYGQLDVTGAVDLSQSGNISVQVENNSSIHAGDVFSNIIRGNNLILPANGFNVSDNSFIWKFTASDSDNQGVNLTASINQSAYNACQGDYCQGAAITIINQVAAGNSIFSPYAVLVTENAFKEAASQATPELTNENIQVVRLSTQSVMDIVPMWNTLHGKSAGDAMLYQPGKWWIKPYGGSITQDESNTVQGFNATVYGAVLGKDIQLPDDWLLGGAVAAGGDNMHGKSVLSDQSITSGVYQAMLYAAKKFPYHIYFAGQGLVGYGNNDTTRSIPLYSDTAKGSYNSWFTNIRTQLGWSAYVLNQDLILTPELDVSYLFINQVGYNESGSIMDLSVDSSNNSSLVFGVYGNGAYRLTTLKNQQDLTLTGYIGVSRNVLNSQPQTTATFLAGGPSFSTFGVQFNEFVFRGGAGLSFANPTKPLKVDLNYDLQAGNNAYSGVGTVTVTYKI